MIFNLCGRHESDLNFSVIVSASAPTQGVAPGVIWVKSDAACTYIQMIDDATKWTSPPDGAVAIICAAANTSNAWMTAIKSHPMYVRTFGCYQRISGAWVSMDAYMWSNAGSWAQFSYAFYATISVTWPAGSTCAIANGDTRLVAPTTSSSYTFTVTKAGTWVVSCTDGTNIASGSVSITASGESKSVALTYNTIPKFTYTGTYKIVNDSNREISSSTGNWNIKFYTSGTLTITDLAGAANGIDIFLVGGGGGGGSTRRDNRWAAGYGACGGGGGYTKTFSAVQIAVGSYAVTVGAGGSINGSGGASKFGSYTASGGSPGDSNNGGNGGSGGGTGAWSHKNGYAGGTNGSDGTTNTEVGGGTTMYGGTGQGTTTKPFGGVSGSGDLVYVYSQGGGGGGGWDSASASTYYSQGANGNRGANTGDGGKGGNATSNSTQGATAGNSGYVIIRNHR